MRRRLLICCLLLCPAPALTQQVTVTANVAVANSGKKGRAPDASNVVLWLTPVGDSAAANLPARQDAPLPRLVQKNKSFEPHVLVVRVGSVVEFPNKDPFFHNVFSLFEGKRFDLGLYEAGSTRQVVFDKPGISYIFCNIHAEMSAVVIAVATPYYGISDRRGQVSIPNVPVGRYTLRFWYDAALPDLLPSTTREVNVAEGASSLGLLKLPATGGIQAHKNLYGHDYPPAAPDSSAYEHP